MAGPIQVIPQGLLGLLNLKQTGKNPDQLLEQVQPTFDLTGMYEQRLIQTELGLFGGSATTAALVTGNKGSNAITVGGVQVQVPLNEMWWVEQCALATVTVAAADTIIAGVLTSSNQGGASYITPVYQDVVTARARSFVTPPMTRPLFVGPGTGFLCWVLDILSVGGITLSLSMRAVRIPI
jgi:hypothetical protein